MSLVLNAASNTPARAVIKHGRSLSEQDEQTSPAEHASPRLKAAAAKRRKDEPESGTHAVAEADNDNVTAVNNSAMAPSGRGEVGGSTVPAGADAPTSCIAASMAAAHAPAASQPDASVHMGQAHGTADPDSESNQQEGEQDQPRRLRGRPKGSRTKQRLEGSMSVISPSDTAAAADLLGSGTDSVKRRSRGKATGSRSKPKAPHVEASLPGDAEDEDENEPSSQLSEDDDANAEDPSKRRKGRSRAGRPAGKPAAEGGGATEAADDLDFAEHPRKRQRGRSGKHKDEDMGDAQMPEGSTVQVAEAGPTASYVAQAPPANHGHDAVHQSAQAPDAPAGSEVAKAGSHEPNRNSDAAPRT